MLLLHAMPRGPVAVFNSYCTLHRWIHGNSTHAMSHPPTTRAYYTPPRRRRCRLASCHRGKATIINLKFKVQTSNYKRTLSGRLSLESRGTTMVVIPWYALLLTMAPPARHAVNVFIK